MSKKHKRQKTFHINLSFSFYYISHKAPSPSPQIHRRIAGAVFLQHTGGGEMLQPFLCCALAQACHALQDAASEAGVGGEIVAEERE